MSWGLSDRYVTGGVPNVIPEQSVKRDTQAVADGVPASVLADQRVGWESIAVPAPEEGWPARLLVRRFILEPSAGTVAGQRVWDELVGGVKYHHRIDPIALTGEVGRTKAIDTVVLAPAAGAPLTVQAVPIVGQPILAALEVFDAGARALTPAYAPDPEPTTDLITNIVVEAFPQGVSQGMGRQLSFSTTRAISGYGRGTHTYAPTPWRTNVNAGAWTPTTRYSLTWLPPDFDLDIYATESVGGVLVERTVEQNTGTTPYVPPPDPVPGDPDPEGSYAASICVGAQPWSAGGLEQHAELLAYIAPSTYREGWAPDATYMDDWAINLYNATGIQVLYVMDMRQGENLDIRIAQLVKLWQAGVLWGVESQNEPDKNGVSPQRTRDWTVAWHQRVRSDSRLNGLLIGSPSIGDANSTDWPNAVGVLPLANFAAAHPYPGNMDGAGFDAPFLDYVAESTSDNARLMLPSGVTMCCWTETGYSQGANDEPFGTYVSEAEQATLDVDLYRKAYEHGNVTKTFPYVLHKYEPGQNYESGLSWTNPDWSPRLVVDAVRNELIRARTPGAPVFP